MERRSNLVISNTCKYCRFYSDYEKNEIYIVNIRQKKKLKRSEKSSWGKKKLAVEGIFTAIILDPVL